MRRMHSSAEISAVVHTTFRRRHADENVRKVGRWWRRRTHLPLGGRSEMHANAAVSTLEGWAYLLWLCDG